MPFGLALLAGSENDSGGLLYGLPTLRGGTRDRRAPEQENEGVGIEQMDHRIPAVKFRFWGVFRSLLSMAVRKSSPSFRLASSNPSHGSPSRMRIPPGTRDRLTTSPATRNSLGSRMAWLRPFMNTFALILMFPDIDFLVSPCQGVRTGPKCGCLKFFSSLVGKLINFPVEH